MKKKLKSASTHAQEIIKKYSKGDLEPTRNIVERMLMMKEFELRRDEQLSQIDHGYLNFREYKSKKDKINKEFDL